jgi:transcriptional regulator with XRE-family HTH domain
MDIAQALELVWRASERSSQALVAEDMGVSASALTRWKQGDTPRGALRRKLIEWAERQPKAPPLPAIISSVALRQAENVTAISQIVTHMKLVQQMLLDAAAREGQNIEALSPYVVHEIRGVALGIDEATARAAIEKKRAELAANPDDAEAPVAKSKGRPNRPPPHRKAQ